MNWRNFGIGLIFTPFDWRLSWVLKPSGRGGQLGPLFIGVHWAAPENASLRCKIVPYTLEDDTTPCKPFDRVMLFIGADADDPHHCLDDIPKDAATVICAAINGES